MPCKNHPEVESCARCSGCQESFCLNCLVEIEGKQYCGSCKVITIEGKAQPSIEISETIECELANEALKYAIIGIFCFGIILEPIAISKALQAKKLIDADPRMTGSGKVTAAIIIGGIALAMWILGMIGKVANISN